jgi:hypothetical protein
MKGVVKMNKIEKIARDVLLKPSGKHILDVPGVMELSDDEMRQLSVEIKKLENKEEA